MVALAVVAAVLYAIGVFKTKTNKEESAKVEGEQKVSDKLTSIEKSPVLHDDSNMVSRISVNSDQKTNQRSLVNYKKQKR